METVQEAIDHYLPKKKSGEMSLADIREEIKSRHNFREEQIQYICSEISELELKELQSKKQTGSGNILGSVYFSYFMIVACVAIFIISYLRFDKLKTYADQGIEIDDVQYFLPAAFMLGAIIYLVRHIIRIVRFKK
ncbi:MAG: hypothetical protein HUJ25_02110 [Crocinitomicaceae bacterium]|nr:hypothetical protein [Crocinitomicaceae bacterium]